MNRSGGLELTKPARIGSNKWDLEYLELQDPLYAILHIRPQTVVVS